MFYFAEFVAVEFKDGRKELYAWPWDNDGEAQAFLSRKVKEPAVVGGLCFPLGEESTAAVLSRDNAHTMGAF